MRCISCSTILLKAGLVSFIFFQLRIEGIYSIVTVPLGVENLGGKKWAGLCAYTTFQPKHQSSYHGVATRGTHGDCVHTRHMSFDCWCTPTYGSVLCLWRKSPLLRSRKSKNHLHYSLLSTVTRFQFMHSCNFVRV
jgi:hypothetical protein